MHMTTLLSIEHWIIGKNLAMCGTFHNRRTVPHCLPARRCCQHPPKPQDAHNGDKLRMGHVFICYFTLYRQAHLIILPTKGFSTALYLCWLSIDALVLFKRAKQGELLDKLAWGGTMQGVRQVTGTALCGLKPIESLFCITAPSVQWIHLTRWLHCTDGLWCRCMFLRCNIAFIEPRHH